MKHRTARLAASLLCLTLLCGCWQEEPPESNDFSDLLAGEHAQNTSALPESFSLPYLPDCTLDPITCPDGVQQVIASLLCEGLFRQTPAFEAEPSLCESYTHDETMQIFTFTLKSGITFSDGSPLTGADVRATLLRAKASPRYESRLADVVSVTASGQSVTVTLASPNSALPALLDIPIVKSGSEAEIPIGTGPYFFSTEDTRHALIANQSWWQQSTQPVERILLVEISDAETALYRFTSRDVQLLTADLTGTDSVHITGNFSYRDADTTTLHYLGCNTQKAPTDSAAFRRMLHLGISRSTLVSAYLSGHGTPAQFPLSPRSPLYPAELETAFSRERFAAALSESGYTPTRTLTLLVNLENSFKRAAAQYLAETFTAAGVPMTVQALPWAEYTAALESGAFDLYYGEVRLSADWNLTSLLGSGGKLNYTGWSSPETDQYLSAYAAAEARDDAMRALCAHLQQEAPILPLCFKSTSVLLQSDVVQGLSPTAAEPFYQLDSCTIHLKEEAVPAS